MDAFPPSALIDSSRLQLLLRDAGGRFSVDAIAECESTNTLLLQRAARGASSGSVLVCDRQTAGRGSRGRHWSASPEASLTFSLLWDFDCGLARISGLSLAVGLAVVQALSACGAAGVTLKWPNDILYRDAKLGGILVELQGDPEKAQAVIGIGLNLRLPEMKGHDETFMMMPAALDAIVSPLPEREHLLASLLIELARVFDCFSTSGFSGLREQWQIHHAWQGRTVRVLRNGLVEQEGVCQGADADGALLVLTAEGLERCLSGDVSLRVAS